MEDLEVLKSPEFRCELQHKRIHEETRNILDAEMSKKRLNKIKEHKKINDNIFIENLVSELL